TLLDSDGRRQSADQIDIWFFELFHKLPRIWRHAVEKTALSLGKQDVERDRRFARAAQSGDDHELFPRNFQIDVLEIVLARSATMHGAMRFLQATTSRRSSRARQLSAGSPSEVQGSRGNGHSVLR